MRDPNASKYSKRYKKEFHIASEALDLNAGLLEWSQHDYEAFRYMSADVRLVFYPHRTTARNYHIRVRDNGSKNKRKANAVMSKLDDAAGLNCTFSRKRC